MSTPGARQVGSSSFGITGWIRTVNPAPPPPGFVTLINAGDWVGIGTPTPLNKLHVRGTDDIAQLCVQANAVQANTNPLIRLLSNAGAEVCRLHSDDGQNTFVGYLTGNANTIGGGLRNTFVGSSCGAVNTTGDDNVYVGYTAGAASITGSGNIIVGSNSFPACTTGTRNIGIGNLVFQNTILHIQYNIGIGYSACRDANNAAYQRNIAIGFTAMQSTADGAVDNIAIGSSAMVNVVANAGGGSNIVIGTGAGIQFAVNTADNVFIGHGTGRSFVGSPLANVFVGGYAGDNCTAAESENVLLGDGCGCRGSFNVCVGRYAGLNASGAGSDRNIFIGYNAGNILPAAAYDDTLWIDNQAAIANPPIYGEMAAGIRRLGIYNNTAMDLTLCIGTAGAAPDGSILALGTFGAGRVLATAGAGTRMFWLPIKAAFRAGTVAGTQWDNANVGGYSAAFGLSTTASAIYSMAVGNGCSAVVDATFAGGQQSYANGNTAFAFGLSTNVPGAGVPGTSAHAATALCSTVFGNDCGADLGYAMASGYQCLAHGLGAMALGYLVKVVGAAGAASDYSFGCGYNTQPGGQASFTGGYNTWASGVESFAFGLSTNVPGAGVPGVSALKAEGIASFANGYDSYAMGNYSVAVGIQCTSAGIASYAGGYQSYSRYGGVQASAYGAFAAVGDAQYERVVMRCAIADGGVTGELFIDGVGASLRIVLPAGSVFKFRMDVVARDVVNGDGAGWEFSGVIKRVAAVTSMIAPVVKTALWKDDPAWDCNVTADDVNEALVPTGTGDAANITHWVATVHLTEVL